MENTGNRHKQTNILKVVRVSIAAMYMVMGAVFIIYDGAKTIVAPPGNYIFGGLLITYGLFRLYRAVKST